MSQEATIRAESVSKKFARTLRRSMLYGMTDMAKDYIGAKAGASSLRADEFWAVSGVDFEVRPGECLGLIGHNGAGKSTLLKMLNGIILPDVGRIEMRGRVGALIEVGAGFHPLLSGRENIYVNGAVMGMKRREIDAVFGKIVEFSGLDKFIDSPVKFYSSGMYVRLGFRVAAYMNPRILLIDEILAVGDVAFQAKCFNTVGTFKKNGVASVLVSHNMHNIARFCDRTLYLKDGRVQFLGKTEEAIRQFIADMIHEQKNIEMDAGTAPAMGTGKVVITKMEFLDSAGKSVESIKTGQSLTFRTHYRADPSVKSLIYDILIRDQFGVFFQGSNPDYGKPFQDLPKDGHLDFHIRSIPANNQVLSFFCSLWDESRTELYDWKRNVRVEVVGNPMSIGQLLLDCDWKANS